MRAAGWTIWRGEVMGSPGQQVVVVLCPDCASGVHKPRIPKRVPLEGQEVMF